ncbi:hypothetical protein DFW101_1503 [Solidesulfovibrio carbinoliphilus subsp. oakridgensis]|uniref:Motility protein A N-terminal domain-containing protein n=1 Tax=Solidesulfovibrio carbinoliphilus subsp. oakridgensis TaxID=694327 RepID=G7Q4Q1_9BACT|nr:motility-associated protein [Solidesulfovibrio carbinoliphilus]EHJ47511.1 hypothetical protein DFW101_1503 [Solidesulfovibrio carbinoliphilus subsp. oakridgensis]
MIVLAGVFVVLASICLGYYLEGGIFSVLVQPAEWLIIFGAALGPCSSAPPAPRSRLSSQACRPPHHRGRRVEFYFHRPETQSGQVLY